MYIYDNDRKFTYMKLLEKTPLEKDRTENTHLAKLQKNNNLKNYRKYTPGQMKNGYSHPGERQKNYTQE